MPRTQDLSANSTGCPIARSVAIDNAATISPRRTPEEELETISPLYVESVAAVQLHFFGLAGAGLPGHELVFDGADRGIEQEREGGQHQDAGEHRVDVERALGLQDQIAHAA